MAQTPTERVSALERLVEGLTARLASLVKEVDALDDRGSEAGKELVALKRDFDREVALFKREVEELKKWQDDAKKEKEEWGRKLWMILPPVLAVLISNALTLAITLAIKK